MKIIIEVIKYKWKFMKEFLQVSPKLLLSFVTCVYFVDIILWWIVADGILNETWEFFTILLKIVFKSCLSIALVYFRAI